MSGLILALSLQKFAPDVELIIYDAVSELSEIGAGIGIWPRVWKTLVSLGLEEDLQSKLTSTSQGEFPQVRSPYIVF